MKTPAKMLTDRESLTSLVSVTTPSRRILQIDAVGTSAASPDQGVGDALVDAALQVERRLDQPLAQRKMKKGDRDVQRVLVTILSVSNVISSTWRPRNSPASVAGSRSTGTSNWKPPSPGVVLFTAEELVHSLLARAALVYDVRWVLLDFVGDRLPERLVLGLQGVRAYEGEGAEVGLVAVAGEGETTSSTRRSFSSASRTSGGKLDSPP